MKDRKERINLKAEDIAEKHGKALDGLDQETLLKVYEEAALVDEEEQILKAKERRINYD